MSDPSEPKKKKDGAEEKEAPKKKGGDQPRYQCEWDDICTRGRVGYCAALLSPLPVFGEVKDEAQFDRNVGALLAHVLSLIRDCETRGNKVEAIYIGKSQVYKHKQRRFDVSNPRSWTWALTKDRFHKLHKQEGRALAVVACFGTEDVPPIYRAHGQDQRHLAGAYEEGLMRAYTAAAAAQEGDAPLLPHTAHVDDGGGGRQGKAGKSAGAVIYLALKVVVPLLPLTDEDGTRAILKEGV